MQMSGSDELKKLKTFIEHVDSLDDGQFKELMTVYPFKDMININIMNSELLKAQCTFLMKLSNKTIFYEVKQIAHIIEFILSILPLLEKANLGNSLYNYLELLKKIIHRTNTNDLLRKLVQRERERILEVLTQTTKQNIFERAHVSHCTEILIDLISMSGMLPLTTSRNLAEIAEIFKGLKVVHELAVLSNIVLKKFSISTEVFNVCIIWLLMYGPSFLNERLEEITLKELMMAMNEFFAKYSKIKITKKHQNSDIVNSLHNFVESASHICHKILLFSEKVELRDESRKLFSIILSECNSEQWDVDMKTLKELPDDIWEWPKFGTPAFFHICSFLCRYSRPIWPSSEVLQSISNFILSYERFQLNSSTLKSICFIYAFMMLDSTCNRGALLGKDLLIMIPRRFYESAEIYTFHVAQLCWILKCADGALGKDALCHWLKYGEDMELLKRCVVACNSGMVLLNIILDRHVDEDVTDRVIQLINSMQDRSLSIKITTMICGFYTDSKLLRRLMLSNPGIPEDKDWASKICVFMACLLPTIEDETVFAAACAYSKNLVVFLKAEPNILNIFCNDIRNIEFLLLKVKMVKDETAIEVLGLLKVLVLVQKRNHTILENEVITDLGPSLLGTSDKIEKCLDLLHLVISKDLFIRLSPTKVQGLFLKLFDLYKKPELTVKCLVCMTGILNKNKWLAFMSSTNLFLEVNCSLEVDECSWQEFVVFLRCWLKILKNFSGRQTMYVAHSRIVGGYLRRVPSLPQTRINRLLKILQNLEKSTTARIPLLR
ncbi:hypothetical protein JTB14_002720 [Gonioctena quinquepunctata]|nr:hypothetical protein JTB14_002720 [Gonioctena quinquepunctata]